MVSKTAKREAQIEMPLMIALTHAEREVFADLGVTKQGVANYYAHVAQWLLAQVADRPISVLRCPQGIGAACFFQKHAGKGWGKHIKAVTVKDSNGDAEYLRIDDERGLFGLVQMNVIELHPWNTRAKGLDRADRIVFDLDPHPAVAWSRIVAAARKVGKYLQSTGLQSFLRTSGGKGFHVVVPLRPVAPWAQVKAFAQDVAVSLAELHPAEFVAVTGERNREDKIFIDWLRNAAGATSVASYSLRARAEAGVAMPIGWEEIGKVKSGHAFTIANVPGLMQQRRRDPWAELNVVKQRLPAQSKR